jgi:hypothetical protein
VKDDDDDEPPELEPTTAPRFFSLVCTRALLTHCRKKASESSSAAPQ